MTRRGDIVIVDFPFTDMAQAKARPAVVVQNDRDNQRLRKTVVAMITGNLRRAGDPSHLFIDPATLDGALSGLHAPSFFMPAANSGPKARFSRHVAVDSTALCSNFLKPGSSFCEYAAPARRTLWEHADYVVCGLGDSMD